MHLCPLLLAALVAQADPQSRANNQPVEPFHLFADIQYVGASEVTAFLITTPSGHILLDGGFVETAPQILANIRKLGYRPEDVKVLINSHAHFDHAGGLAELKRATGARLAVMEGDVALMERGGLGDFTWGDKLPFPPARVDRVLHDGDTVELGGTVLKAVFTPGHTKGCTTWTMTAGGRKVVFLCSISAPGYQLIGNAAYPRIVEDYRATFQKVAALPCDVFLGSHGSFFDLAGKAKRLRGGDAQAFVDPEGCRRFIAGSREDFETRLRSSLRGAAATPK